MKNCPQCKREFSHRRRYYCSDRCRIKDQVKVEKDREVFLTALYQEVFCRGISELAPTILIDERGYPIGESV